MSRRAAAATFAGCRSGITRWRNTACGGATLALCQLRCIAPAGARRRSAMWGALVRQGGATLQRHSVQCSGDQRDHGAWRVTRKGGRRIDRPHRASRSCRRDARAPGVRSRHAGATPAHLARTFTPQPSCGRDARAPGTHSRHAGATPALPARTFTPQPSYGRGRPRTRRPQPSCGRDARAPGAHSRRAGTTPALPTPTVVMRAGTPAHPAHILHTAAVVRARRPRTCTFARLVCHAGGTPALPAPTAVTRARRPRTWHPQPSCGHDARAPGAHSRRAGATPALPARTFTPQPSCGRGRPRTCTFAPLAATGMNFGLHSAEAGASRDTANPDCVHWTGSRGGAEAQEICQFESSYTIRVSSIPISSEC